MHSCFTDSICREKSQKAQLLVLHMLAIDKNLSWFKEKLEGN